MNMLAEMARLREVPLVLKRVGAWTFSKRVFHEIFDDRVFNLAASVAFYWLLAIFPFLIFVLTLSPLLPTSTQEALFNQIIEWAYASLAPSSAEAVLENIQTVLLQPRGGLLSMGLLTTVWAASAGMNATMNALDICYDVSRPRNFFYQRSMAIVLTLGVVIAGLCVVILVPLGSIVIGVLTRYMPDWATRPQQLLIDIARYTVGLFLLTFIVSAIYQFGTSVRRRWTLLTPGALVAVVTMSLLAVAFRAYIAEVGQASYDKTYGTLGGVMIMLLLFFLYGVVFLIGAEINSEIDFVVLGLGQKHDETDFEPLPRLHKEYKAEAERFNARIKRE